MAISATLNTAKYCRLIKSVTEPNIVRSRAFRSPPVSIMRYPVFSLCERVFHDFQRKIPIQRSIRGTRKEMPGMGVPKATPVFLTWVILRRFQITENSGSDILTQYFVRISAITISMMRNIFFISSILSQVLFLQVILLFPSYPSLYITLSTI